MPYTEVTVVIRNTLMVLATLQNVITPELQAGKPETSEQSEIMHIQQKIQINKEGHLPATPKALCKV